MPVDYHVHAVGHKDRMHTAMEVKEFLEYGKKNGLKEIGFADHDKYKDLLNFDVYNLLMKEYPDINIRVGIEIDYFPGQENKIREIIAMYDFDYVIGSVHYLNTWMFDHPDYVQEYKKWQLDDLYEEYFRTVRQSINSGLFNIAGHLDLIKIFNYKIEEKKLLPMVTPILDDIKKQGMVMEINTSGLYRPVKEIYPSLEIIKMAVKKEVPLTISSDAHRAEDVGRANKLVVALLQDLGIEWVAGFSKGKMYKNFIRGGKMDYEHI